MASEIVPITLFFFVAISVALLVVIHRVTAIRLKGYRPATAVTVTIASIGGTWIALILLITAFNGLFLSTMPRGVCGFLLFASMLLLVPVVMLTATSFILPHRSHRTG